MSGETPVSAKSDYAVAYWMPRVLKRAAKAGEHLSVAAVHDLRTSLRRCLAIEEALAEFDPHPAWEEMRSAAKGLLKGMGALRDTQVLLELLRKLPVARDAAGAALRKMIEGEQKDAKKKAAAALGKFDPQKWKAWQEQLAPRANWFLPGSPALKYVALERWQIGYERHRSAMQSRSKIGYHRARVALKTLRYTAEIFLPAISEEWGKEPKQLQTLLGEIHDFDVLWSKLKALRPPPSREETMAWTTAMEHERKKRLADYARRVSEKKSAWRRWRAALPSGEELDRAVLAYLAAWSRLRTPEFTRIERVADLSAKLFDALDAQGYAVGLPSSRARYILQAAALLEDAGRADGNKGHHKHSYRLIRKLPAPMGWTSEEWQLVAVAARYHRKALPKTKHREFRELPASFQHAAMLLAGILRVANALEQAPAAIRRLQADTTLDGILICAYGLDGEEPLLSKLANAKHLLEIACGRPVTIVPAATGAPLRSVPLTGAVRARVSAA